MRIFAAALLAFSLISFQQAIAQETVGPFTFTPTNKSGVFQGTPVIDGISAAANDIVAAFDEDGNCAGAAKVIEDQGNFYINLSIYGDDLTSETVDEGMNEGESFTLKFYDVSASKTYLYKSNPLLGWENSRGAPMSSYDDTSVIYKFSDKTGNGGDGENRAPKAPQVTQPKNGSTVVVGGEKGGQPIPPDSSLVTVVKWTAGDDPDSDSLEYTWQLASDSSFSSSTIFFAVSDTVVEWGINYGVVANILDRQNVGLGESKTFYHRVVASDGLLEASSEVKEIILTRGTLVSRQKAVDLPHQFQLLGNYPNPFNPVTNIRFELSEPALVTAKVFDTAGRQVMTLPPKRTSAGVNVFKVNAATLTSGLYIYRLIVETDKKVKAASGTMTLLQ